MCFQNNNDRRVDDVAGVSGGGGVNGGGSAGSGGAESTAALGAGFHRRGRRLWRPNNKLRRPRQRLRQHPKRKMRQQRWRPPWKKLARTSLLKKIHSG